MCKVIVDFKKHERTQEDMKRFHMLKKSLPSFKSIIAEVNSNQESGSVYEKQDRLLIKLIIEIYDLFMRETEYPHLT